MNWDQLTTELQLHQVLFIVYSGGSMNSPSRGRQLPKVGRQHTVMSNFPDKLHEEFGHPGRCKSLVPHRSANGLGDFHPLFPPGSRCSSVKLGVTKE